MQRAPEKPEILSVRPHQLGGLDVNARYACGHVQRCWFPQAEKRSSRRELKEWVFGWNNQDDLCSVCQREKAQ